MKKSKLNQLFVIFFSFLFIVGMALIILGNNNYKTTKLKYKENNSIKYNVYLKPNDFFETPYLGEDRTYIASLIDYVDVKFHYDMKYDKDLKGTYKYQYVALVRANKKDTKGYYWQKEYNLTDENTLDILKNHVTINDNIKIDYKTYNNILNKFKKEYDLNTDGELKVIMKITNDAKLKDTKHPIEINSELSLTIPLLEQAIEVSIDKEADSNEKVLVFTDKDNDIIYLLLKITGVVVSIFSLTDIILLIKSNKLYNQKHKYDVTLQKILKNYDSIIANASNLPNMDGMKRIEINKFEELLDVYNEVRMPINFYQKNNGTESDFIIINDNIVWIYKLINDTND